jgi:MFS family permease
MQPVCPADVSISMETSGRKGGPMTDTPIERPEPTRSRRGWVPLAVCLVQFMLPLDLTVVNTALADLARNLGASTSTLQWVADAYNLTVAALLLAAGRAGDRLGHKRIYLTGLAVFGAGSALCAAAPDDAALVGSRVLQGVGAAIELPATLAILSHTFPDPTERAQAVGVWASAAGSALVVGQRCRSERGPPPEGLLPFRAIIFRAIIAGSIRWR